MKYRKFTAVAGAVMALSLGLAGCSSNGSGDTNSESGIPKPAVSCDIPAQNIDASKIDTSKVEGEITFQTQGLQADFAPFFKQKIAEFEAANPGTKINWTDQGGGTGFDQAITSQAANCQMADVVNVASSSILALSTANLLMDLDVKAPGIGDKFISTIWDSTALGAQDHHTALPWYFGPYVTTYNKQVFERAGLDPTTPPKTMEDMLDQADKVAAAKTGDYAIYGSPDWYLVAQLHGMGIELLNKDHTAFNFADNQTAINYVQRLSDLYKNGGIPHDSLTGQPDPGQAYADGNLAFGTPNASYLKAVRDNNRQVYENTGIGQFPTNPDVAPVFEGQYVAVSVTTKNAPLSVKFAEFITNAENQYAWAHDGGAIVFPSVGEALDKIVAEPPTFADDPVFQEAYEEAAKAAKNAEAYLDIFYVNGAVQSALVENVNAAIRGEVAPAEALQSAQKEMNRLLDELNADRQG